MSFGFGELCFKYRTYAYGTKFEVGSEKQRRLDCADQKVERAKKAHKISFAVLAAAVIALIVTCIPLKSTVPLEYKELSSELELDDHCRISVDKIEYIGTYESTTFSLYINGKHSISGDTFSLYSITDENGAQCYLRVSGDKDVERSIKMLDAIQNGEQLSAVVTWNDLGKYASGKQSSGSSSLPSTYSHEDIKALLNSWKTGSMQPQTDAEQTDADKLIRRINGADIYEYLPSPPTTKKVPYKLPSWVSVTAIALAAAAALAFLAQYAVVLSAINDVKKLTSHENRLLT